MRRTGGTRTPRGARGAREQEAHAACLYTRGVASCCPPLVLASVPALTSVLTEIARAPVCCVLKWTGLLQDPLELATTLVALASNARHESQTLRFVSSNSGNAWVPCIAAAYFQRVHGGVFNGLALSRAKSEWSNSPATRVLMRMLNVTWRNAAVFDARNESALMSYRPQTRSSLSGPFFSPATAFLPADPQTWPEPLRRTPPSRRPSRRRPPGRHSGSCRIRAPCTPPPT